MAEISSDLPDGSSTLEHVGGKAVTQGVDAEHLVLFIETAFDLGEVHCRPDAGFAHGFGVGAESFPQGKSFLLPGASHSGEQPFGVAMLLPEGAETLVELGCDGNFTCLAAFALWDANDETLAIDVFGLDINGFAQAKTTLVDDGEVGAVAPIAKGAKEQSDFVSREDMRERFRAVDFDFLPDVPVAIEMIAIEEANGTEGLIDGTALQLALLLQVHEKIEHLLFTESGGDRIGIVKIELSNPAEVVLFGFVTQLFEVDDTNEVLIPFF